MALDKSSDVKNQNTSPKRGSGNGHASPEQLVYADLLNIGMKLGLAGMILCFVLYVSGILSPEVPLADLPRYWGMPLNDYLAATGAPTGWDWMWRIHKGDYLNLLPVAFLATITIACYLRILPMFSARGEYVYSAIIVIEIGVLLLAVSGLMAGGH